jgi:hypothetical protein
MVLEGMKIGSWFPTGAETKNDCAGEDQKQFTASFLNLPSFFKPGVRVSDLFRDPELI